MAKIKLEVIQPIKTKIKGEFDHIIIPGIDGDFGISKNHTPFVTKIRTGILLLYKGEKVDKYAIHDGFVTVENNQITIVTEVIEKESEIDKARAKSAKLRAEKRLKSNEKNINFRRAEFALKRALVRLDIK